ncbi:hypothetical protein ACMFMG_006025 [Clarireedia jacksonii]
MEKCWFVLRQTHYPAPEYTRQSMAFGEAEGPILLGHFIPSPKDIDQVINRGGIIPFPRDMPIWATSTIDLRFSNSTGRDIETSAKVGAPIATAVGMTVNAEAGIVFRRMMGDTWAIDRLDTQIVQPTLAYLEQCRASAQVAAWVDKNKMLGAWKAYMVSGLMIARGAKNEKKDTSENGENVGVGGDVPSVATAEMKVKYTDKKGVETSGQHINDFIWAIRLSEVSKSLFVSDLSQKIVTKGTVFAPHSDKVDIKAVLAKDGLDEENVHTLEVFKGDEQQFLVAIDGC